jgi:hypothetical protein
MYERKVHWARRGGYTLPGKVPSRKLRAEVVARDEGRCRTCGAVGTEVDHVDGRSSTLENLQLLCHTCHEEKTLPNLEFFLANEPEWFGSVPRWARGAQDSSSRSEGAQDSSRGAESGMP